MLILTVKTDNPEAEIGLFEDERKLEYERWHAHRELSLTLHQKIETLLRSQHKTWQDVGGVVCFEGPGSFTGLRIGIAVGNAIAYGLGIGIVATRSGEWIQEGVSRLLSGHHDPAAIPFYGAEANITLPRK